jgi:hypothetical protein
MDPSDSKKFIASDKVELPFILRREADCTMLQSIKLHNTFTYVAISLQFLRELFKGKGSSGYIPTGDSLIYQQSNHSLLKKNSSFRS